MKKRRLDEELVARGLCATTDDALRAIIAREVKVGDAYATSAACRVSSDEAIFLKDASPFVSRGGVKLQAALDSFEQDVNGLRCIDIGSSTGGFTDCLLQRGAAHVACVDVNYGQLAWSIRTDERVSVFERTNIRTVDPATVGAPFDLAVADLSFIGLARLAGTFASLLMPGGVFIGLVKPQFESQHDETDRGVVRSEEVRLRTVSEVSAALESVGLSVSGVIESPIHGRKGGNVEYLVRAVRHVTDRCREV